MVSIEALRNKIREYDFKIIKQVINRSKYFLNRNFYSKRGNHSEFMKNSVLFSYANDKYLPIISEICQDGEDREQWNSIFNIDIPLITDIMQRTSLGVDIAKYKDPKGLPIYVKEIEDKKRREFEDFSKDNKIESEKIKRVMQLIMDETKRIEHLVIDNQINLNKDNNSAFQIYRGGSVYAQDILEDIAREEIKKLERENMGFRFSLKKRQEKNVYLVEIHKI